MEENKDQSKFIYLVPLWEPTSEKSYESIQDRFTDEYEIIKDEICDIKVREIHEISIVELYSCDFQYHFLCKNKREQIECIRFLLGLTMDMIKTEEILDRIHN